MKWSVKLWIILVDILLSVSFISNVYGLKKDDTTVYNRMICENEKLQIGCKEPGRVLNIQRAYYGRYSITPCNKNHIQYTMGCTANNTLSVLKSLCQGKSSCRQKITSSLFEIDLCPGVGELEVNYFCVLTHISDQETFVPETTDGFSTENYDKISISISNNEIQNPLNNEVENHLNINKHEEPTSERPKNEIFGVMPETKPNNLPLESENFLDETTAFDGSSTSERENCLFSDNFNISKHFNFGDRKADIGQYINIPCTDFSEQTGTNLFKCESDGKIHFVNSTCTLIKNKWIAEYQKELEKNETNPLKIIENLNIDLKREHENFLQPKSIESIVNLIENASSNVFEKNLESERLIKNTIIHTADTLIEKNLSWRKLPKIEQSRSATKLMDVIENVIFEKANKMNIIDNMEDFLLNTKNLIVEIRSNDDLKSEIRFPKNETTLTNEKVLIKLKTPEKSQNFMFIVYKSINDLLRSNDDLTYTRETLNKAYKPKLDAEKRNIIVNSNIISFKMNREQDVNYLKKVPIELTFRHIQTNDDYLQQEIKPICSFWNYDKNTYNGGYWSSEGCEVKSTNKTHTVCQCRHLTHFAILMDVYGIHETLPKVHEIILTFITIVCSFISCISIIIKLLVFRFLKIVKKNREQSTTKDLISITTHLCICLLISLCLFLTGIVVQKLHLRAFCSLIALMSHYFFLCSFFWMLLEGVQLYFMLVRIFILDKSPINKFCVVAYGIPFVIVFASKLADIYHLDSLGYGTSYHCWISTYHGFNLTFIIPVSVILMINFIMLIIVIHGMRNTMASRQTKTSQKQDEFFKSLFGFWCIILTLLGLPWLLGYLIIDTRATLIFSYLFTIINSSQGTIVFVFHCILSKSVREELLKMLRKNKFGQCSKNSKKSSLLCYASSSRSLQRGPNDSSSFKSPRKFFDSVKLIDRKSSNCSSSQSNSTTAPSNRSNGLKRNKENWIINFLYQLFCSCFLSDDNLSTQTFKFDKNVKNSQSFSTNTRNFNNTTQSPLRNYSSSLSRQTNSFNKTITDEDCINLLQNEPCSNCQNLMCTNVLNSGLNKQIINNTLGSEKPTLLQMYLTNEASKNLYNQKYLYGNIHNIGSIPNASKMNRTSSHLSTCSNSSNNPTQTTYLSPISSTYLNNNPKNFVYVNNCVNCQKLNSNVQIPNMPPPPLPPFNASLNQYCGVNASPSTASTLRNKDSFVSNKSEYLNNCRKVDKSNFRLPPVPMRRDDFKKPIYQDENQYLQPECNTYSMVDSEFQSESQYYCDDGICGLGEHSNMYSEVFEDYIEEPYLKSLNTNKSNKQTSKLKSLNYKGKLKDLIAMPEEFDKEDSVEHSHISDRDLFNMTSILRRDKQRMEENLELLEIDEADTVSNSPSSNSSVGSTLMPASSVLNGLFTTTSLYSTPEDNSKIKESSKI